MCRKFNLLSLKKKKNCNTLTYNYISPINLKSNNHFSQAVWQMSSQNSFYYDPMEKMQILMRSETNIHLSSPFSLQSIFSFLLLFFFHVLSAVVDAPSSAPTPLTLGWVPRTAGHHRLVSGQAENNMKWIMPFPEDNGGLEATSSVLLDLLLVS